MPDEEGVKPVSKVLLKPVSAEALSRDKASLPEKKETDFQLNSLGGPLEEDFTANE